MTRSTLRSVSTVGFHLGPKCLEVCYDHCTDYDDVKASERDLRRAVATVKACAHIPQEDLEKADPHVIAGAVTLHHAVKCALNCCEESMAGAGVDWPDLVRILKATDAKARGEPILILAEGLSAREAE